MQKIAIQGQAASFHDKAAQKWFGHGVSIIGCDTLSDTFIKLADSNAKFAVVAIENSLYGSINETYDLLLNHNFLICGEIYLRIKQNLVGLPGTKLSHIKEVHSHPIALAQCEDFLTKTLTHAERCENHDTAGSAQDVKSWGDKTKAAIASVEAAKLNGLEILAEEIETNKQNYTRFVVLKRPNEQDPPNEVPTSKSSIIVQTKTDTKPGALYKALGAFTKNNVNLTLLHSRPLIGKAWHYMFYIDFEAGQDSEPYNNVLDALASLNYDVKLLGSYNTVRNT